MRRHRDWSCDPALGDLLEDQRAIYMAKLDGRTRDQQGYTKNDMTRQFPHDIDLADDVLAPVVETVGEDASMIDIGTGIGTFAVLGAHHGIQATGIERDELPYQVATGLQDTVEDEGFLEAELAYVNDDFYDWAEDDDKTLEEADIVVAYLPGEAMQDLADWLTDNGPDDAVYVFPELAGREPDGYTPSPLNETLPERLQTPLYEKEC